MGWKPRLSCKAISVFRTSVWDQISEFDFAIRVIVTCLGFFGPIYLWVYILLICLEYKDLS